MEREGTMYMYDSSVSPTGHHHESMGESSPRMVEAASSLLHAWTRSRIWALHCGVVHLCPRCPKEALWRCVAGVSRVSQYHLPRGLDCIMHLIKTRTTDDESVTARKSKQHPIHTSS